MDLSKRATVHRGPTARTTTIRGLELRYATRTATAGTAPDSATDGTAPEVLTFAGYASVTGTPYQVTDFLGEFTETISPGAFAKTLAATPDVPFLINHTGMILARTTSGTLRLSEDATGLRVVADLDPGNPTIQALRSALERGDMDEMSFAFTVTGETWNPDYTERVITAVDLDHGDVSVVNYGANQATSGAGLLADPAWMERLTALPTSRRMAALDRLAAWLADDDQADGPTGKPSDLSTFEALRRLHGL